MSGTKETGENESRNLNILFYFILVIFVLLFLFFVFKKEIFCLGSLVCRFFWNKNLVYINMRNVECAAVMGGLVRPHVYNNNGPTREQTRI